jgi:isoaspartyl peptidase/L-asparaginase-like protein (Ntn-hydrolase superfamily)
MRLPWAALCLLLFPACLGVPSTEEHGVARSPGGRPPDYAIAIHGGAGSFPQQNDPVEREAYTASLRAALEAGVAILDGGGTSLDAVESVIRILEDDPLFNAGRGAVYTNDGRHELDASLMDGASLACGGVAGVTRVKNPISLARLVMERTPHVLLAGPGADQFAKLEGVDLVDQEYYHTERRLLQLQRRQDRERAVDREHGTVGAVALDRRGNLAAGTSTGGLTGKQHGRVGDSPLIGAGTFAKNATCAVSGTGTGEEFIRHGVARSISDHMEYGGLSLQAAADQVVLGTLEPGDGGIIAVSHAGELVLVFNTEGMARGAADSRGRFEVHFGD